MASAGFSLIATLLTTRIDDSAAGLRLGRFVCAEPHGADGGAGAYGGDGGESVKGGENAAARNGKCENGGGGEEAAAGATAFDCSSC